MSGQARQESVYSKVYVGHLMSSCHLTKPGWVVGRVRRTLNLEECSLYVTDVCRTDNAEYDFGASNGVREMSPLLGGG